MCGTAGHCRGETVLYICANVAHQNSLCRACQGAVECKIRFTSSSHSILDVVYSHLIGMKPKAGIGQKWARKSDAETLCICKPVSTLNPNLHIKCAL